MVRISSDPQVINVDFQATLFAHWGVKIMPIMEVGSKNASKARVKKIQEIGIPFWSKIEENNKNTSKHLRNNMRKSFLTYELTECGALRLGPLCRYACWFSSPRQLVRYFINPIPMDPNTIWQGTSPKSTPKYFRKYLDYLDSTGTRYVIEPESSAKFSPRYLRPPGGCWSSEVPLGCLREVRRGGFLSHGGTWVVTMVVSILRRSSMTTGWFGATPISGNS